MKPKERPHRAWSVLAAMMLIQAGTMGVLFNCNGILFSAVLEDMKFRAGDLSLYYMLRSLSSAALVGATTKLFFRRNPRIVLSVLGCLYVGSFGAMAFFHSLWQWYAAAIICGVGMSCNMVVIPIVLSNWFRVKNGLVIGITMSASGMVGALFSPVCSRLIEVFGWRTACLLMAGIGFCLIVVPSRFFLVADPKDVGCQPYGGSPACPAQPQSSAVTTAPVPRSVFFLCLAALIGSSALIQFNAQLPTYAQAVGYSLTAGAMLTSLSMVGNLVGKLTMGALADKLGIYRTGRIFFSGIAVSMAIFRLASRSLAALNVAAVLYGAVYAIGTTVPPLLFLDLYGPGHYREKVSRMQAVSGVVSAFLSAAFPYAYDLTGSFNLVFLFGFLACAASFFLFRYLHAFSRARQAAAGGA